MPHTLDGDALQQALLALLEESLAWQREKPDMHDAEAVARVERSIAERTLSPGYYKLGDYLFWLEGRMKIGAPIGVMLAIEAEGLYRLAQARGEFERGHPPCSSCGELQDGRFALMCWSCGLEFKR